MDLEGIGIGVDGMSGDSNDVSFVVAMIIVSSSWSHRCNFFIRFENFLLTSFCRTPDYVFADLPTPMGLFLLDYGAGNVQSLANTLGKLGHSFKWITSPADFDDATVSLATCLSITMR
jgi:hypothetical protein